MNQKAQQPERYIIYSRLSVKGINFTSTDETSIPLQIEKCKQYVEFHGGTVVDVVTDEFESGGNTDRTGFGPIMRALETGTATGWDGIIVFKLDRLSRSVKDTISILDLLHQQGKSFISVTERLDYSTALGKAQLQIFSVMSEYYRNISAENVKAKMDWQVIEQGKYLAGGAPYGYVRSELETERNLLVPDPCKAAEVLDIYQRYAKGESVDMIAALYEHIPVNTIFGILKNQHYTGKLKWAGKWYKGKHEAIISKELFECVQDRFPKKKTGPRPNSWKYPYLLIGLTKCHCGRSLSTYCTNGRSKRYHYYQCTNYKRCRTRISAPKLEKAVVDMLKRRPLRQDEIDYMIQKARKERQAALENDYPEYKVVTKALAETLKEKQNLETAFKEGLVTDANAEYVNVQLDNTRKQVLRLTAQQAKLKQEIEANLGELDMEAIIKSLRNFSDCLKRACNDPDLKRDFIRSRVWEIQMHNRAKFTITLNGGQLNQKLAMTLDGEVPAGRL